MQLNTSVQSKIIFWIWIESYLRKKFTKDIQIKLKVMYFLWLVMTGNFTKNDDFNTITSRCKFFFHFFLRFPSNMLWLFYLIKNEKLTRNLILNPRLTSKLHRPYLKSSLSVKNRLCFLKSHYTCLEEHCPTYILDRLLTKKQIVLAKLTIKDGTDLYIVLEQAHGKHEKEGELCLKLRNEKNVTFCTLTFTMHYLEELLVMTIGGLQGPSKPIGLKEISILTKNCYGLFPKKILIESLISIGKQFQVRKILGVGNKEHIYRNWRYSKNIYANYDRSWEDLDGSKWHGGTYLIPMSMRHKPLESIPSKKRSYCRRRFEFSRELVQQISMTFKATSICPANGFKHSPESVTS